MRTCPSSAVYGRYDGDTPQADRAELRGSTRVFLTNPDMLHCAVLPHHKEWAALLSNLKYVVLDEAHTYAHPHPHPHPQPSLEL